MDCGIILFIYDRPQCTRRVLESLKKNLIDELYVFQDGIGENTNEKGWEQNIDIINKIDWCNVHYERNVQKQKCLDDQIVFGVNKVFEEKDEIIVIEDDCIISDDCIRFMKKCFDIYRNNNKIIDIGAYLEPINVPEYYSKSVIAAGIPSGQVWGTWKNRWEEFKKDFSLIKRIGDSMKNNKIFDSCGYPVKKVLTDCWILGTWDLWWSIFVLISKGISIRPKFNKVYNIGFENPGTHTSGESPWIVPISEKRDISNNFPADLKIELWAEKEFEKFYQEVGGGKTLEERQIYYRNCLEKWIEFKQNGKDIGDILLSKNINKVAIYGIGRIGKLFIQEIGRKIEYFIVTNKNARYFMKYPVYGCDEILHKEPNKLTLIVIPGYDMDKITGIVGELFLQCISLDELFIEN